MTPAERARAVARQRRAYQKLRTALAERGHALPPEARLLDVEASTALLAKVQEQFPAARSNRQYREHTGLDRVQLAEYARAYFAHQRSVEPLCLFSIQQDIGALALPASFLSEHLGLLLDIDGDAVFGEWGSEVFVFDYTADLGPTGYEVLVPIDSSWQAS
jgi:hypothetical protein